MTMGTDTSTFKSTLIHAAIEGCTRDILLTSSMTLYQLHKFILNTFGLSEPAVGYHNFTLISQLESIETSYEIIDDQEIEGFITPVAPGVYIEHTHPHEPLPLFSIYYKSMYDEMSFRMIRDERFCTLDNIPSRELYYEFEYHANHYSIHLNLQSLNLPIHFLHQLDLNPKIISKNGDFLNNHRKNPTYHFLPLPPANLKDESWVKNACNIGIQRLIQERKRFLLHQPCEWIEPTGEKCVYCTLCKYPNN